MEIQLADEHVYVLEDRLTPDEIRQRAMDRRVASFGSGLGSILQRPKPEDIELVASQHRREPFWHVAAEARYVYDRARTYSVAASGPEVKGLTIYEREHEVASGAGPGTFTVPTVEHCRDEFSGELFVDGVTGAATADGATVIGNPRREVGDLSSLEDGETIVVPPEQRASFVVRQLLGTMMKPVQADKLDEESLTVRHVDLYYRPWWAFEFLWRPKNRTAIVELDGVTGQIRPGTALMVRVSRMVNRDTLFDIGADTVGLIVPGGSIAVKVAKLAIEQTERPSS
jgi:hypothetical protein